MRHEHTPRGEAIMLENPPFILFCTANKLFPPKLPIIFIMVKKTLESYRREPVHIKRLESSLVVKHNRCFNIVL